MSHTPKASGSSTKVSGQAIFADPAAVDHVKLSPRVEALRRLVESGQYQVSPLRLAHQIMRAAGLKPE